MTSRRNRSDPSDDTLAQENQAAADKQGPAGHGGKVENDFNQVGEQKPTQRNEGKRTPNSRSDRESHVGGSNQLQSRRGSSGGGR
jgi:hypothetical protein